MTSLRYKDQRLHYRDFCLTSIAEEFGTPCYVYSRASIEEKFLEYKRAFGDREYLICYAVKANSNLSILKILQEMGSGFDIVSGGELERIKLIGGSGSNTVFSGVGKTIDEIKNAIASKIGCVIVETRDELDLISREAERMGIVVPVSVRVNPNVDPKTHPYISTGLKENKFGVPVDEAMNLYRLASSERYVNPVGIACHIGSQLTELTPVVEAVDNVVGVAEELKRMGIVLNDIDVGGGLGIRYKSETPPSIREWLAAIKTSVPEGYRIKVEPGRSIVGSAGVLLTRVRCFKSNSRRSFAVADAAMNDLLRPALYGADHKTLPCSWQDQARGETFDLVGPICETSDWLVKDQTFVVRTGDVVAILDVGAYGFGMASNYNSRPRAAEVLVETGRSPRLIRSRESFAQLVDLEIGYLN